jgi:23S rRNA-intervening sequence protein
LPPFTLGIVAILANVIARSSMFFPKTYSTIVAQPQDMHNKESFRNLKVWQRSMILVEEIYRVTRCFPRTEQFVEVQLEIANRVGFLAQAEYEFKKLWRKSGGCSTG